MPIYAYRCSDCGFQKDYLQKISDPILTDCPTCGKATFAKQLTAPGFQLKGNGWYATDFKGGTKSSENTVSADTGSAESSSKTDTSSKKEEPAAHSCGTGACGTCA